MLVYILKRIFYFIPTFFIIALITFFLSSIAPGDPVEDKLNKGKGTEGQMADKMAGEQAYNELNEKLGRNLPTFYFSITTKAYPDTLYKILRKADRETLTRLIDKYGNWANTDAYFKSVKKLEIAVISLPPDTIDSTAFEKTKTVREACSNLYRNYDDEVISTNLQNIQQAVNKKTAIVKEDKDSSTFSYCALAPIKNEADAVATSYAKLKAEPLTSLKYIPAIHWYGTRNQFHRWLFGDVPWFGGTSVDPAKTSRGFFRGDFGNSYLDDRPVSSILRDAMGWTLLISFIVLVLIYVISIPAGVSLAVRKGTTYDRVMTLILFILNSVPSFWVGTMLIIFFTSDYYGNWMNLFPPYGLGKIGAEYGFWEKVTDRSYHLILPVFCSVYGSFAYISRQMRGGMLSVLRQDYIRTAFAKGLQPNKVYWKHAFRNSLIPIITLFSSFLPAMISGSVVIEYLFTIPAMGRVSYESVVARNFPVLFTILMFSAILTMLGTLISDILYVVTDPRISFTKKEG
jgi:peptide/nickel transport system permease protein